MPKSKIFWFDGAKANVGNVLKEWQRHRGRDADEMAAALHFGRSTWFSRMRNPSKLTLEEVWRACNYLKIPFDEALAMLTAGLESTHKRKGG